ncbi:MAG: hypothetical protein ABI724_04050 [Betaproteobacteria bacterium]
MDRPTNMGGNTLLAGNSNPMSSQPTSPKVDGAAQAAHQTVDKVADKATMQVDRLSGTAHRAVNSAADAAGTAAEWASTIPDQAKQMQAKFLDTASAQIRGNPVSSVAGAVVIGYLLGRLARL